MCSCLDSVTKTSAYGVDLASPPLLLRNRPSGPSMRRNVPENAKRVQHVLGPERRPTGSPNVYKMACNSCLQAIEFKAELARPAGFEPTTPWFVAKYSISDNRFEINTLHAFICATVCQVTPG